MNKEQFDIIEKGKGFIAAFDQDAEATVKALRLYGIYEEEYNGEEEMYDLMHMIRTRIMTNFHFNDKSVIGAVLTAAEMNREIEGKATADYLWEDKHIVPFLKIENGLAELENGVQLMNEIPDFEGVLANAKEKNIFGTCMRSVIKEANEEGIKAIVAQQMEYAKKVIAADMIPIIEPEINIHTPNKFDAEEMLVKELKAALKTLDDEEFVIVQVTIPEEIDGYYPVMRNPQVLRVAALCGGYSRGIAVAKLSQNRGMIAGFSKAFTEGFSKNLDDTIFTMVLKEACASIAKASNS